MEGDMKSLAEFEDSIDLDDSKYLCGLSTILVASIQELKDRVSQIEFIFCSQLFPNFQSRSSLLHKKLIQTKKAAEDEWRKKENSLLNQIEEIRLEKRFAQEQIQQLNFLLEESKTRLMGIEQSLSASESEKKQLLDKMEVLESKEEIIAALKEQLRQKSTELTKEKELQERLLRQIELKDNQLAIEQKKRRCLYEEFSTKYKQLKSQYNFVVRKTGFTTENNPSLDKKEDVKDLHKPPMNKRSFQDCRYNDQETMQCASKSSAQKIEISFQEKLVNTGDLIKMKKSDGDSCIKSRSSSGTLPATNSTTNAQSKQISASSCWKNTRARQEPGGVDPHDDFLDTPMELLRNSKKGEEEVQDLPKEMDLNNSDYETQDIKEEPLIHPQNNASVLRPVTKGNFKFVEPVRGKTERDNLKGIECKQCKKFYDAVLPNNGDQCNDKASGYNGTRCEHQEGVSRHRYRYAPPLTPEGFWNIGFDSEK
ncbi:DNA endonuclease Ctp1 C-terminal protein [Dioscorea alata]|uniref:DNA endonuclease Ctp1 C-terminal protein n=1 Tax=Dioscorea alata TaxID=55571 RepID=A0ACB7WA49_DIOAL|nr:DNA endonuclease Ctp1 C-terminal protein [Dioscorea alata]